MKVSNYVTTIEIDEEMKMLYSTFSRQYYVYDIKDEEEIKNFFAEVNKGVYNEKEMNLFQILLNKKIIVRDEVDELRELEYLENSARYQGNRYKILVYATNACNFRCDYCTQPHIVKNLDSKVSEKLLKLISKKSGTNRKIEIDWFGGEPLLQYEEMCSIMEQANEICNQNKCDFMAGITTNGYLLTQEKIKKLKSLNVEWMQITLDGNRETHNKRRMLVNGGETFDIVLENVKQVLKEGIHVIFRINVDKENIDDISHLLDAIPKEHRIFAQISICNIFQNEEKLSTFSLLKQAIEKGYRYAERWNKFVGCQTSLKNAAVIDTDGSVLLCSNAEPEEKRMGCLDENGNIRIERSSDYYKVCTLSARDNPECHNCIELPFCIACCMKARLKNNKECFGRNGSGLSLKERALLDYYYDLQKEKFVIT